MNMLLFTQKSTPLLSPGSEPGGYRQVFFAAAALRRASLPGEPGALPLPLAAAAPACFRCSRLVYGQRVTLSLQKKKASALVNVVDKDAAVTTQEKSGAVSLVPSQRPSNLTG